MYFSFEEVFQLMLTTPGLQIYIFLLMLNHHLPTQ